MGLGGGATGIVLVTTLIGAFLVLLFLGGLATGGSISRGVLCCCQEGMHQQDTVLFSGLNLYIWREVKPQAPRGRQRTLYT